MGGGEVGDGCDNDEDEEEEDEWQFVCTGDILFEAWVAMVG